VRLLYSLTLLLLMPLALGWFMWRSLRQTGHADKWGERLGSSPLLSGNPLIWVHGASVGEIRAAAPLVEAVHQRHPQHSLLVTSFTAAGRDQAQALFGGRALIALLPYDLSFCVNRWLKCVRPTLGIIMETEIWPNLFAACARRGVPLLMVSARLSPRALIRYRRFRALMRRALAQVAVIAAQSAGDAEGLRQLGAVPERLCVGGNLKFDVQFPETLIADGRTLRARLFPAATVIVAGSTRENEEALVVQAYQALLGKLPDCTLVLAPRHPERAAGVAELLKAAGLVVRRRSAGEVPLKPGQVLVLDTLGELTRFYAAADVAYVGGSLVPLGGHNLLEPAALGLPVLAGPHLTNVADIAELLRAAGGLIVVADATALGQAFLWLASNAVTRRHIGQAAQQTVLANRGALAGTLELVEKQLARS
jgi:3-deoxy-D-manno-octulosonic-acid transferase